MIEKEIIDKFKMGKLNGMVETNNCLYVPVRITGTGNSVRFDEKTGKPYVEDRLKQAYTTPAALDHMSKLPILVGHPKNGMLGPKTINDEKIIGMTISAMVKDDDVIGLARIYDKKLKNRFDTSLASTSPGVAANVSSVYGRWTETPEEINHLALVENGHWDQKTGKGVLTNDENYVIIRKIFDELAYQAEFHQIVESGDYMKMREFESKLSHTISQLNSARASWENNPDEDVRKRDEEAMTQMESLLKEVKKVIKSHSLHKTNHNDEEKNMGKIIEIDGKKYKLLNDEEAKAEETKVDEDEETKADAETEEVVADEDEKETKTDKKADKDEDIADEDETEEAKADEGEETKADTEDKVDSDILPDEDEDKNDEASDEYDEEETSAEETKADEDRQEKLDEMRHLRDSSHPSIKVRVPASNKRLSPQNLVAKFMKLNPQFTPKAYARQTYDSITPQLANKIFAEMKQIIHRKNDAIPRKVSRQSGFVDTGRGYSVDSNF